MLPGISGSELIVIALAALIVIGPKDLPKLMRQVGKFIGRMRSMAEDFRSSFDDMARQSELDDLRKEVEALRTGKLTRPIIDDVNAEMQSMETDINDSLRKPVGPSYAGTNDIPSPDAADHEANEPAPVPEPAPLNLSPMAQRMAEGAPPSEPVVQEVAPAPKTAPAKKKPATTKPKAVAKASVAKTAKAEPKAPAKPRRRKTSEA